MMYNPFLDCVCVCPLSLVTTSVKQPAGMVWVMLYGGTSL